MKDRIILILMLQDGCEIVINEFFDSEEEAKRVLNEYYSIRKVRSRTGYWEAVIGYSFAKTGELKTFRRKEEDR